MIAPATELELLARARSLAGLRVAELARDLDVAMPHDERAAKGFVGGLVEKALGATSGSKPQPDFDHLGVELKTIPLSQDGVPAESTYVCTAPLRTIAETRWEGSVVHAKLARVLFVAVESSASGPLADRRLGVSWLWSPSNDEQRILEDDWTLLAGTLGRFGPEGLTAHVGRALQLRPKAADSRIRTVAFDEEGGLIEHNPRGFYLRPSFTKALVPR